MGIVGDMVTGFTDLISDAFKPFARTDYSLEQMLNGASLPNSASAKELLTRLTADHPAIRMAAAKELSSDLVLADLTRSHGAIFNVVATVAAQDPTYRVRGRLVDVIGEMLSHQGPLKLEQEHYQQIGALLVGRVIHDTIPEVRLSALKYIGQNWTVFDNIAVHGVFGENSVAGALNQALTQPGIKVINQEVRDGIQALLQHKGAYTLAA